MPSLPAAVVYIYPFSLIFCVFITKTVEISWNWQCKSFGLKFWRCKIFDKFHVCGYHYHFMSKSPWPPSWFLLWWRTQERTCFFTIGSHTRMIFWLVESLLYLYQYKMSAPVVISVVVRHHISCLHVPRIKLGATPTHVDLQNRFSLKLVEKSKLFLLEGPFGRLVLGSPMLAAKWLTCPPLMLNSDTVQTRN